MPTRHRHPYPVYIILAVVAVLAVIAYFMPTVPSTEHIAAHRWRLTITVAMAASFCGSTFLFLRGLDAFRSTLRSAYRWFSAGNTTFGVAMLQWPVMVAAGLQSSFWALSGIVIVPFLLGTMLMYVGMRRFALLLGAQSILISRLFSSSVVIVCALACGLTAHLFASNNTAGIETETYTATVAWTTAYGALAWLLVRKVLRIIGSTYQRAMRRQAMALGMLVIGGMHECATSYFLTENDWYIYSGASTWPFVIVGFLFVWAGYTMSLTRFADDEKAIADDVPADDARPFVDSILNIAGLASRPEDIDSILDGLRGVTASMQPGAPLTEEQIAVLADVYAQLEQYLTTADPLRVFTREELEARLVPSVRTRFVHAHDDASSDIENAI